SGFDPIHCAPPDARAVWASSINPRRAPRKCPEALGRSPAMQVRFIGLLLASLSLLICLGPSRINADDQPKHGEEKDHVMVTPEKLKWGPAPPSLPKGAEVAVLAGDPTKKEPFTIRVKLPDGFKVPPHWHPTDENVTVIKGTF